jgi:hypothetical protein
LFPIFYFSAKSKNCFNFLIQCKYCFFYLIKRVARRISFMQIPGILPIGNPVSISIFKWREMERSWAIFLEHLMVSLLYWTESKYILFICRKVATGTQGTQSTASVYFPIYCILEHYGALFIFHFVLCFGLDPISGGGLRYCRSKLQGLKHKLCFIWTLMKKNIFTIKVFF